MKTAQRRVARPLIVRNGGTHMVDLAVGGDTAARGMVEDYSYEDRHGDKITTYSQPRDKDVSPLSSFGYGAGDVVVTECADVADASDLSAPYLNDDIQSEPAEGDGQRQDAGGGKMELPRRSVRAPRR